MGAMAYECMSFLPDLTDAQIAKQVDYMIGNGWTPCVEFEDRDKAIAKIDTILGPGYYHNRYWNMWKLPLFGCTDGTQVISEIKECLQTYPDVTVRVTPSTASARCRSLGSSSRSKPPPFAVNRRGGYATGAGRAPRSLPRPGPFGAGRGWGGGGRAGASSRLTLLET